MYSRITIFRRFPILVLGILNQEQDTVGYSYYQWLHSKYDIVLGVLWWSQHLNFLDATSGVVSIGSMVVI
jgi:hypothetical protein